MKTFRTAPKELISRAFKSDFPQFVDRAKALGVRVTLSNSGGRRVYWLDGYRQLTGYTTRKDGSPFSHADAVANIDKALTDIEDDRRLIEGMSEDERFARIMSEFRKMKVHTRMIGEVRFPSGDRGYCFFNANYDGEAQLHSVGTVARAKAQWARGVGPAEQMALFCDLLESDYASRRADKQTRSLGAGEIARRFGAEGG